MHLAPAGKAGGSQGKHLSMLSRPGRVLNETKYGDGPVRVELAERDAQMLAPVTEGKVEEDRIGRREIQIDMEPAPSPGPPGTA